jgi:hypothetical protein
VFGRSSDFHFSISSKSALSPIEPPDSIKQQRNVNTRPNSISNIYVKIGDGLGLFSYRLLPKYTDEPPVIPATCMSYNQTRFVVFLFFLFLISNI